VSVRAAVDIGTNSMRLLVVDGEGAELGRWEEVTGLGRGVDGTGRLSEEAVARTLAVLSRYGRTIAEAGADHVRAVATSASRDAANAGEFLDRAEAALGVRPEVVAGVEEARLSFAGATAGARGAAPYVVVDIGGGSTELVWEGGAASVDIGSVRLTERLLPDRPASPAALRAAAGHVAGLLAPVGVEPFRTALGVAGTWTSLAAVALSLPAFDRAAVDGTALTGEALAGLVESLARLTVEETAAIPALDPKRAPVILAGAVVAERVAAHLGADAVVVSTHDLLDGIVAGM